MPEITLTFDVPEFTEEQMREAIIKAATFHLLGIGSAEYDDYGDLLPNAEMRELKKQTQASVSEKINGLVEEKVPAIIDEVMAQEYSPVDRYGDASKPTTIRKQIAASAERWLTAKVNSRGETTGYGNDRNQVRMHWLIAKEVESVFKGELRTHAADAAKELKTQLRARVTGELTAVVVKVLGIEEGR